jgi:signal transduction histidine kinase
MQSNDVIEVVAPLGGRIFFAAERHLSCLESGVALFVSRIDIPVIGGDGQIAGVLCRDARLSGASTPPTQDQDTAFIGEAAKTILHDIANLLATIDGGLQLLERQTDIEGRQRILERMRHSVQRIAISSRKLLGGNSIQQNGDSDIVTRRDLVAAVEDLRHAIGPGRSLRTDIAQDLSDFSADPDDLYFALLNLCRNASAALRCDGEVVISANNSVPRSGALTEAVGITVADNGSGMTDEMLRRAFESPFTTKPVGQGSGLGLGQVRKFVQESGGAVEIESELGVGTAVKLMLQAVPATTTVSTRPIQLQLSSSLETRN